MAKKIVGAIIAIAIIVVAMATTPPEGLTREGLLATAMLFFAIVVWACDVVPMGISSLFIIIFIPILSVLTPAESWAGFGSVSLFFIIATSAITTILLKTSIPIRTLDKLVRWSKGSSRKFAFGFMAVTALFSAIMSNIPITMAMLGFALVMIRAMEAKPLESNFAKCLLIGVPSSAMVGGMMTPVGTTVNIVAMDILQKTTDVTISFFQWMLVGIPVSIVVFVFMYFSLIWIFKPEPVSEKAVEVIREKTASVERVSPYEIKVVVVLIAMFALWILNGVFPALNTTYVAVCGLLVMFLPKIELLTFKEFIRDVPWNVALVVGAVNVITAAMLTTGAAGFIATSFANSTEGLSLVILALTLVVFFVAFNGVFPMGPGAVGLLGGPAIAIAVAGGILSPAYIALALAFAAGATFLLPINPLYLITLDKGYFKFGDVVKAGILPSLGVIIACMAVALPLVGALGL